MNRDMNTQLRDYTEFFQGSIEPVEMEEILYRRIGDGPVRPVGPVRATHRRGWATAAVAAMITVIVLGSVAWLSRSDGDAPAVDETPPTTAAVTPTTEAAITTDTFSATTTTLVVAPIVPPGEGQKLSFVEAIPPSDGQLSGGGRWFGEWFDGSVFVPSGYGAESLFRSTDGLTWALVPGLPASGDAQEYMLQADEDRIVNVVMPENDGPIRVNISTNGDDWLSSTIDVPIFGESNGAGKFSWADQSNISHSVLAVGPQGIVVAASMTLVVDGERFANSLVGADEGIHVEIIDLDLERSVMVLAFLDEENDMEQIGDLREIDLNSTSFGRDYAKILKAMAADPDWEQAVDGIVSMFPSQGYATAVVQYAWFSSDGTSWQRLPTTGPLDGGQFASVLATPTGFVATAVNGAVWESTNGTVWIEASGRGNRHGSVESNLVAWQGAVVEHIARAERRLNDSEVWTLTDPPNRMFADVPTTGMRLEFSDLGLIGTPTYGWEEPVGTIEVLLSIDGTSWNRWKPSEFGQNAGWAEAWIVGIGDDFVVIQVREWDASNENESYGLWVGTIP